MDHSLRGDRMYTHIYSDGSVVVGIGWQSRRRCIRTQGFIYCVWLRNGVERGVEEVLEIVGKGDVSGDEFLSKD